MARLIVLTVALAALLASSAHAAGLPATKTALAREMARAGGSSGAYVVDMSTGQEIYAHKADTARMPASVEKLYTAATAMLLYGPEGTLTTSVLASALPDETGTVTGDVVLRGGGDPTFNATATAALAKRLADGGLKRVTGRVIGDESVFDAFRGPPSSNFQLTSYVGPLSALSYNHGRTGQARPYWQSSPAKFAASAFEKALERRGVKIAGAARSGLAPTGMTPFSEWTSPPVATIARQMNVPSDNYIAEMLIKSLGAQFGGEGSTTGGAAVMRDTLRQFEIAPTIADGSGLSRANRTTPREVVRLLTGIAETEHAEEFDASLAVIGRNGTVSSRLRGTAAQDNCHAKTGTLRDVSALAGYCTTTGGSRVAFAFLMNGVYPPGARTLQDRMTTALARYDG
ncbi:D-alanyl-D-alanine carboxypeptidase/D-alanyl-D-alanine-endopeptidase [Solirubrobacter sp. CPCC 204708]|uniref:D-alanyl-D-alanine carboxypeptidase/D-alanyl-D-alanine-endopeptidase n=1 Tax=Solirubrobacter deserti TaxID=2282478 RepID=A0ABT4RFN5_9ACTN|nr:D-alanyl-D-alanine carboxypeptidase/D-alanyl-D-alanine-endopeptidase [Solirubrobacter deserti]MBE2318066.1 D-alanyl-D-alanine carboxypeptidase/D-alanyl-D-alanine-endopeptidase [Solirubrobacter deserti]MDA0137344.1 D-alanyl-D-alanine carboxypeptidase/D-alanyl-D-alanine-endopeptidase [Solirubrobacter deserti]